MSKKINFLFLLAFLTANVFAQHSMEKLDRGLVAVKTSNGVFLSWRIPGEEWHNTFYSVYRDGQKLNSEALQISNYTDAQGSLSSTYTVAAVVDGVEQEQSAPVSVWAQYYKELSLDLPQGGVTPDNVSYSYTPNDMSVGHLNEDNNYDLVIKWDPSNAKDNSHSGYTGNVYLDGYTLQGEKLWRIDLGINIRAGAHYTQFMVYDLDGDGIAEIACKTAPGTKDGLGNFLSKGPAATANHSADYRNSGGYILEGPEYLTIFDGRTGAELTTVSYNPARGSVDAWGDGYGNRVDRFLAAVAYLDGKHPSLVMARGYYTRTVLAAYDFDGNNLTQRWVFDSNASGNSAYAGQGNHNLSVADVDADGKDEIVYGSCTIDDNGKGLYNTYLGHGDAMHVNDFDPYRKGLEVFKCLESGDGGTVLFDAANGDILIRHKTYDDCGRCMAGNVTNASLGAEVWGGGKRFSATNRQDISNLSLNVSENFRIYWDGDLLSETLNHTTVTKPTNGSTLLQASGCESNNGTKGTPGLQADLLGDWREELVYRTTDPSKIRIFTTTIPGSYRNYTLMHDRQYRLAVAWQNVAYNQPPHPSYFLGEAEGILLPPPPLMTNKRLVYKGGGVWDKTSEAWMLDAQSSVYSDGQPVFLTGPQGTNDSIELSGTLQPSVLSIASPGKYFLNAENGKLSGNMKLIKQGSGVFSLNGTHDFSGPTEIWDGKMNFSGSLSASPLWLNINAQLAASGQLDQGLEMRFGSQVFVGGQQAAGVLNITGTLSLEEKAELVFEFMGNQPGQTDQIHLNGDFIMQNAAVIRIIPAFTEGEKFREGEYTLLTFTGNAQLDINKISLEGIPEIPAGLVLENDSIKLVVRSSREPATVYWKGSLSSNWDLVQTKNFWYKDTIEYFVTGDTVIVNDEAGSQILNVTETVMPSALIFENNNNFVLTGKGEVGGNGTLTKRGSGKLSILNTNSLKGKVLLEEGILELKTLPNSIDGNGAIGPVSANAALFEINGGTLGFTNAATSERALTIGSAGATMQTNANVNWNARISGGRLIKTGNYTLSLSEANTNTELLLKAGTVQLSTEQALPGRKVIFEGGTLKAFDSSGSYSAASYPLVVEEGQFGRFYVDSRCSYTNTLTGGGTLYIYVPWVRSDFNGNWSNFTGTIKLMNPNSFRNYSTYGYAKAVIDLGTEGVFDDMKTQTVKIGSIKGKGRFWGAGTWEIGYRNEDFTFQGNIETGLIKKVGTGIMTLSSAMTSTANFLINEGGLTVYGLTSGPGTSNVYIKDGAFMSGNGNIQGSVIVENGGRLYAGMYQPDNLTAGTSLRTSNVQMQAGSNFVVKVDPGAEKSDMMAPSGNFVANGNLIMQNISDQAYQEGQSFQIVRPGIITGGFTSVEPASPGTGLEWDLSEFTSSGLIKVVAATALEEAHTAELLVYPNPTPGKLFVQLPQAAAEWHIKLENLDGQLLLEQSACDVSLLEINLTHLKQGLYIITVHSDGQLMKQKVLLK